jgi:hypothetical protein
MNPSGTPSPRTGILLVFAAYRELLAMEFLLWRGGFAAIHRTVAEFPQRATMPGHEPVTICRALDIACVFYFKEVLCLQRSAAAVRLLRKRGVPAELVTGVQQWPFSAHAWAEVAKRVVNDKPHVTAAFAVIDRC